MDNSTPLKIQSGGKYGEGVETDNDIISDDTITLAAAIDYGTLSATAKRTLIINPDESQKATYKLLFQAFEVLVASLKSGTKISEAYSTTLKVFSDEKDAEWVTAHVENSFGAGTGFKANDSLLSIIVDNTRVIASGNVFKASITLSNLKTESGKVYALNLCDTVIVTEKIEVVTGTVAKDYQHISYTLDDSEGESGSEDIKDDKADLDTEVILEKRTRGGLDSTGTEIKSEIKIKQHQEEIYAQKDSELQARFARNDIHFEEDKKEQTKILADQKAYKSEAQFPKGELKAGKVYVDAPHRALLFPIGDKWLPLHISFVKSVSKNDEGQWSYLRLNLHTPGETTLKI